MALSLPDLLPGPTDRAAFIGQTGSGKTTLAREILAWRDWVVVYDPKGMIRWKGYEIHTHLDRVVRSESARIIYKPSPYELRDPVATDRFFEWVYKRGNTTLYVDEVYAICQASEYPIHYGACLTRGRERGISTFTATQRPSRIPMVVLSESEFDYCFSLKIRDDRKRVEELTGIDEDLFSPTAIRDGDGNEVSPALPKYHFYFAPQSDEWAGPLKLKLPSEDSGATNGKRTAV